MTNLQYANLSIERERANLGKEIFNILIRTIIRRHLYNYKKSYHAAITSWLR